MNLFIVYAHPSPTSFNASIRDAFVAGAKEGGHIPHILDLYAEKFDPILRMPEKNEEEKEIVKKHQDLIRWADWMVFIYPVWWLRAPAILEGWMDCVLTAGFAFHYKKILGLLGIPFGLLPCRKAVVIETYGGPRIGIAGLLLSVGWRRLKWGVLKVCGFKTIKHFPFYSVPSISEEQRKRWLEKIRGVAVNLR